MKARPIIICLLGSFLLFMVGCRGRETGAGTVVIEPVKVSESSPIITVPGILAPRDRVEIRGAQPAKISEVFVNKGDVVTEGAILARLSEEEINLKLNQLKATRKEAETLLEKNQSILKNRDKLQEEGKLDKTQAEAILIETANNEASLEKIKADIAVAEYNTAHLQIKSPIKGVIVEKYASPLQVTAENQLLFVIVNTDPIIVSFQLSADESTGVKLGLPVTVKIDDLDGEEFKGTVSFIGPEIGQEGRTFDVWALISNPENILKSGMFASVQLTSTNTHKVIVIPVSALITRGRDKFVFTVTDGLAKRTKVKVRNTGNNVAEISSGLMENDFIAAQGAGNLYDGASVDIRRR